MHLEHIHANHPLVGAYDTFSRDLFGFDLSAWRSTYEEQKRYRTFSLIEGNEVIANISAMKMILTICGRQMVGIQLGSVGVRREHRGKGITHDLMSRVLQAYPGADFFYLLSDEALIPFYGKHGFQPVREELLTVDLSGVSTVGKMFRIRPEDPRFWRMYDENRLNSTLFNAHENRELYRFHLIMGLGDCLYLSEDKPLAILGERVRDVFEVYDLIGASAITPEDLLAHLAGFGAKRARFHFAMDAFDLGGVLEVHQEDVFFFRGNFPLADRPFKSPETART